RQRSDPLRRIQLRELSRHDREEQRRDAKPGGLAEDVHRRADAPVSRRQAAGGDHASDRQGLFGSADRTARRLFRAPVRPVRDAMTHSANTRRQLLKLGAAGAFVSSLSACATMGDRKSLGKVVVIGAGYGGATAAKYLRLWSDGMIDVTLVDANKQFISCPLS